MEIWQSEFELQLGNVMDDVVFVILTNIDAGSTFKSARLVSHSWRNAVDKVFPDGSVRFANQLQTIVKKMLKLAPEKVHRWSGLLSNNPNITWSFIGSTPEIVWRTFDFVTGPNLTDDLVDFAISIQNINSHSYMNFTTDKISLRNRLRLNIARSENFFTLKMLNDYSPTWWKEAQTSSIGLGKLSNGLVAQSDIQMLEMFGDDDVVKAIVDPSRLHRICEFNKNLSDEFVLTYAGMIRETRFPKALFDDDNKLRKNIEVTSLIGYPDHIISVKTLHAQHPHTYTFNISYNSSGDARLRFGSPDLFCELHKHVNIPCDKCRTTFEYNEDLLWSCILWNDNATQFIIDNIDRIPTKYDYGRTITLKNMKRIVEEFQLQPQDWTPEGNISRNLTCPNPAIICMGAEYNESIPIDYLFTIKNVKFHALSRRSDLTWKHVIDHFDQPWDWHEICRNGFKYRFDPIRCVWE